MAQILLKCSQNPLLLSSGRKRYKLKQYPNAADTENPSKIGKIWYLEQVKS